MVQAIENWADLAGTVRAVKPAAGESRMGQLVIQVERSDDVEGYPNLLANAQGEELAVAVRSERLDELAPAPGARVRLRAQRASPTVVVAHPESVASE
jgi:hypothetical protein